MKNNRRGGRIAVRLMSGTAPVRAGVADNGIGMDDDPPAHRVETFNRLGRQASRSAGSGPGLLFTRHPADAMGGRLIVDSRVGIGSRFALALPADTGHER